MLGIKRALISVHDKTGLVEFARGLRSLGVELVSTHGTADFLRKHGVETREVSELTGYPELLRGKVKTLHPAVFAGILARRQEEEMSELRTRGIQSIDMVVVNLHPFPASAGTKPEAPPQEVMAHFDVGGHALLRASVKNYEDVVPVVDPGDYCKVLQEIERGELSESTRLELASKAMAHVGAHDQAFQVYLEELKRGVKKPFPETLCLAYRKLLELRYGENPHLRAVLYADGEGLARAEHIGGPPPSFNNFADMDAGWDLVLEFEEPAVAIIKHGSPCGVAVSGTLVKALESARACDPPSAYGSVIAINRPLDRSTAENLISDFVEVVVAPGYDSGVVEILERKRRLRIFRASLETRKRWEFKQISGGVLVQEPDVSRLEPLRLNFVTRKKPSETELKDLVFAWRVVKHVKSNAIVLAKQLKTVGIGGGQPSRVGAVELAVKKAGSNAEGSVLASDGFFPFADSIELAARTGVSAVIQPGGSIRDSEVISAADERGLKMVFTGVRCFKH